MKSIKFFTAGFVMLSAVGVSNAQNEADNSADKTISFGVKGGVNFATVTGGEDFDSPDSRTSFHVGAVAELPFSDQFSVQAEALYSGQGFKLDFSGSDGDKAEYQLDYINVPVLAKFYLTKGFSVEAGPQFSFLVNEEFDSEPFSDGGDVVIEDGANSFEFGVAAGVTFQTEMGLFASGRYNYGITEIYEDSKLNNSVFQISLGYKF